MLDSSPRESVGAFGSSSRAIAQISIFIAILASLAVLTEGLSWLYLSLAKSVDPMARHSFFTNQPWAVDYWEEVYSSATKEYHPYVVWRRAPFHGRYIQIDGEGRRRTLNPSCNEHAPKIWMFGPSTLWGTGARDSDAIPSIVSSEYARSMGPVCVLNLGQEGWSTTQGIIEVELMLKRGEHPDLVIVYGGSNDVGTVFQYGALDSHLELPQVRSVFMDGKALQTGFAYLRKTNTYRAASAIMEILDSVGKQNAPRIGSKPLVQKNWDGLAKTVYSTYEGNWRLLRALSKEYDFKIAGFWSPSIWTGNKPLAPAERLLREMQRESTPGIVELYTKSYDLVFGAGRPNLFSLADVFDGIGDDLYFDHFHVAPPANRLIGVAIVEKLRKSGIVPLRQRADLP